MRPSAPALRPSDAPAALGAALNIAAAKAGKGIAVTMAYADRLERFTRWWVQLWAESVGKDGKGTQPVAAIGPGGPAQPAAALPRRPQRQALHRADHRRCRAGARHGCGAGQARRRAGLCRQDHRRPRRRPGPRHGRHAGQEQPPDPAASTSRRLDERAIGELLMHFMLETILAGYALGRRSVRPARGGRGQDPGEANIWRESEVDSDGAGDPGCLDEADGPLAEPVHNADDADAHGSPRRASGILAHAASRSRALSIPDRSPSSGKRRALLVSAAFSPYLLLSESEGPTSHACPPPRSRPRRPHRRGRGGRAAGGGREGAGRERASTPARGAHRGRGRGAAGAG